ncbi:MAG: hypothetical protein GXX01_04610 [Clostridiales bacterium]|jgi:sulfur transfer protein SufE|nr:hypothetical protein [Clostridiales bacterium]
MKVIAIERGLEELKQSLEEKGYNTVFADEADTPVSVYIYKDQNALEQVSFQSSTGSRLQEDSGAAGVLLIPGSDKTPEQIIAMIENRVYTPLFYY